MSKPKVISVTVEVGSDEISFSDLKGNLSDDEEYNKDFMERLEHQNADILSLLIEVTYGTDIGHGNMRLHHTGDSLGGVQVYTGSDVERRDAEKYVRSELETMLTALAEELYKTLGLDARSIRKAGKEAIENVLINGVGKSTVNTG